MYYFRLFKIVFEKLTSVYWKRGLGSAIWDVDGNIAAETLWKMMGYSNVFLVEAHALKLFMTSIESDSIDVKLKKANI
jgi:hypothetical protein